MPDTSLGHFLDVIDAWATLAMTTPDNIVAKPGSHAGARGRSPLATLIG